MQLVLAIASTRQIGRPRFLTWSDVKASGAVSDRYEADVRPLVSLHERDAETFIDRVAEIGGFRRAQSDRLRAHLVAEGILPTVAPLDEDDLLRRTMSSVHAAVEVIGGADEASAYLLWVLRLLRESEAGSSLLDSGSTEI